MVTRFNVIAFVVISFNAFIFLIYSNNINEIASKLNKVETELYQLKSDKIINFPSLLQFANSFNKDDFFVIEPWILQNMLKSDEWENLQWRFNLNDFSINKNSLTLGTFNVKIDNKLNSLTKQHNFTKKLYINGRTESNKTLQQLTHAFFNSNKFNLHVVVFHRVESFWWIGKIPDTELLQLNEFNIQFGKYEAIYDLFQLETIESIKYPNDIQHFLSEIPTSRYIGCTPDSYQWMEDNKVTFSNKKVNATEQAIVAMKSLMREQQMEFWMACGTLLGWYRQCHVTPYTSDTDFSSWSKYVERGSITNQLRKSAPNYNLKLRSRFGEPKQSIEYSFQLQKIGEKVDLFFIYPNETHFRIPYHVVHKKMFTYSVYPKYSLCSAQLLGFKLLAPCESEKVIVTEYGPNWKTPVSKWVWYVSPKNSDPLMNYVSDIAQYQQF